MGKLLIISGPSCVGKSPLKAALARLYPEVWNRFSEVILFNSRSPRPAERDGVDYHFRPRQVIEELRRDERYAVLEARGDLQALDVCELHQRLRDGDAFYEGNPFVGSLLLEHPALRELETLSLFVAPLSKREIRFLREPHRHVSLPDFVADVMRRKLLRRTRCQKGILSQPDLQNIEKRACSAYDELKMASRFDWVVPNHDGEDSENWSAFYYPVGDAFCTLQAVVTFLTQSQPPERAERWDDAVLP